MEVFAVAKLVVYFLEWVWSLALFAVTADKLYVDGLCAFGAASVCQYVIAAGVIGWLTVSLLFIGHSVLGMMGRAMISAKVELFVNIFLYVWWFICSIVISVENEFSSPSDKAVFSLSWLLFSFTFTSICLACKTRCEDNSRDGTNLDDVKIDDTNIPPTSSVDV